MTLIGIGAVLIAVGVVLALTAKEEVEDIGWLLCVGGVVVIVVAAVMAATSSRRKM